jgi:hypothetical protein
MKDEKTCGNGNPRRERNREAPKPGSRDPLLPARRRRVADGWQ